jgi:hypothetical protein
MRGQRANPPRPAATCHVSCRMVCDHGAARNVLTWQSEYARRFTVELCATSVASASRGECSRMCDQRSRATNAMSVVWSVVPLHTPVNDAVRVRRRACMHPPIVCDRALDEPASERLVRSLLATSHRTDSDHADRRTAHRPCVQCLPASDALPHGDESTCVVTSAHIDTATRAVHTKWTVDVARRTRRE